MGDHAADSRLAWGGVVLTDREADLARQAETALAEVYGDRADFADWTAAALSRALGRRDNRPASLKQRDARDGDTAYWLQRSDQLGYSAYLDLFAGDLNGLRQRIDYLRDLGVTYLHLLPFYASPEGGSDGGFAVTDYRRFAPGRGEIDDMEPLIAELERAGIRLCLDFVLNHVASDHAWAEAARRGEPGGLARFQIVATEAEVARLEQGLPEIFPVTAPGNFTRDDKIGGWVRTTFYPFQWDLNYENPAVFCDMLDEMLWLANLGASALRLDSAPFLWKGGENNGRNAPQTHAILRALRAYAGIAAPSLVLKAEAIVPSQEIARYLGAEGRGPECHIAYHAAYMSGLWTALATEEAEPLAAILNAMPTEPDGTAWLAYLRCHDDIGLGILEGEAAAPPYLAPLLRKAAANLTDGAYAEGALFETTPGHDLHGVCGTLSALCGLQKARREDNALEVERAIRRYRLLHAALFAFGGLPALYMGDEIAAPNAPVMTGDLRWLHRGAFDWNAAAKAADPATLEGRLRGVIKDLKAARAELPAQSQSVRRVFFAEGPLLVLKRAQGPHGFVALMNFSAQATTISEAMQSALGRVADSGTLVYGDRPDDWRLAGLSCAWFALGGEA